MPLRFEVQPAWHQLPPEIPMGEVPGVATDSAGNLYAFNRGPYPVIVFDRQGRFLRTWGEGFFTRPHGITIGPDDAVYCVDDLGHNVHKFTLDGEHLFSLTSGQPSNTGAKGFDYRTIERAAGPFNCPTSLAIAPSGDLYVADGYGNARVHRFSPQGKLLGTWGVPGAGRSQFHVPHGIAVDGLGRVYVADRENSRIQRFSPEGAYLDEWPEIARPCQVLIDGERVLVAELGYRAGMFPGNTAGPGQTTGGRLSIFDLEGKLLSRFGGGDDPCAWGDFFAPHDLALDRFGDLYVGEVTLSGGGNYGLVSPDCHALQKFIRVAN
jgi:DNA-binding beta-propeller fold protein YncE